MENQEPPKKDGIFTKIFVFLFLTALGAVAGGIFFAMLPYLIDIHSHGIIGLDFYWSETTEDLRTRFKIGTGFFGFITAVWLWKTFRKS